MSDQESLHAKSKSRPKTQEQSLAELGLKDQQSHSQGVGFPMSASFGGVPVVGLGGSAGGIAALRTFFSAMPPDSGMAFVVVLHLSPDHESNLADILRRATSMSVVQVSKETSVEANRVYVIPPGKQLTIAEGRLHLSKLVRNRGQHVTVDLLFQSLADYLGPDATAVVLSGADGDGCIGVKRIKECGGLTIAQEPDEAELDSMPRSAIATGMVDWILSASEIPGRLIEFRRAGMPGVREDGKGGLQDILSLLQFHSGHDFSYYRRAAVLRRIGRRMQINGIEQTSAYLQFLRGHPGEADALYQELLSPVTYFFRDPEAFAALEREIPRLFEGKQAEDTVRVWVAAGATGEEAYSVAMLLQEHADKMEAPPTIKVFATDLDERAIRHGRGGVYPETIGADVSPERLERFFSKHHRSYRVEARLREVVLFAVHDVLKDPPFSRVSLIVCRNFLFYLNPETQGRLLEVFHHALIKHGLLLLGISESAINRVWRFEPLDEAHRLYERSALKKLPSRNEGRRSATGEVNVSQEELQSINEELIAVNQELTSRVEELAQANGDLANLMASTQIATIFLDGKLRILRYTPSAASIFRFIPADAGRPLSDLAHRLDYPAIIEDAARVLACRGQSEREIHGAAGEWWLARMQPYRTISNETAGVVLTFVDITKWKKAEDDLRESEARFRLANIHSPFPLMLHADDGEILQINDAWTHQSGYQAEELSRVSDWVERAYPAPELQRKVWQFLNELPGYAGAIESKGRRIRCADGSERIWDINHASLGRLADGRTLRITTAIDVTERYQDDVALRLAKEEAEKANRAKSEFLSRMSHELRTPLNAVLGFGQILALSSLGAQEKQCVGHILTGGKHLLSLVDEVLDLAKVEAGELALKPAAIPVDVVLRESLGFVAKMAEARGITCKLDLGRSRRTSLWADEQRFRQVLLNLLGNAIKYNRTAGTVTVLYRRAARGRVRVGVRDTGQGIAPDDLARLFTPFERLGQEYKEVEGTGLGLVVSKQLVQAMHGKLWVESEVGKGSTFWLELPEAAEAVVRQAKTIKPTGDARIDASRSSRGTLLYIEDSLSNLQVMRTAIDRLRPSWQFLSATDGRIGLQEAREHLPDLILLDLQLPGMKGDSFLSELRNDPKTADLPVVMLSADATKEGREKLLSLGARDYSSKPFNLDELLEKLDRILRARGLPSPS